MHTETLSTPAAPFGFAASAGRLLDRFASRVRWVVLAMQYARMREALSRMSDAQLDAIRLARADIPVFARRCVYGPFT